MTWKNIPVIIRVELHEQSDLPEVVEAGRLLGLALGIAQGRQEKRGKDGNDGDDDQ